MRKLLYLLPMLLLAFMFAMPTATSAHTLSKVMPATTSCNTLPNNADCDGQPTPGGCTTGSYSQGIDVSLPDGAGNDIGSVDNRYSPHCMSNWPHVNCQGIYGAVCYSEVYRASGPDGGVLDYYSTACASYCTIDGYLVYAPNNQTQVRLCGHDTKHTSTICSSWTPLW